MLGSRSDAEDIVQETYLRWHQTRHTQVESPEAWLVTSATRLCIDRLRRLKTEREAYTGQWLPEPIVSADTAPDHSLDLAADLSIAFMTLLQRLAPEERAAFLLHDVALTFAVIVINAWNRLAVPFRAPVGSYQPKAVAV